MNKVHLNPRNSFTILCAEDLFNGNVAKSYFEELDLSAGLDLYDEIMSLYPLYPEIIVNRKYAVRTFAESLSDSLSDGCQVIVLGAGWSPVGLELLTRSGNVLKLMEVDRSCMDEKRELYEYICPDVKNRISFIQKDVSNLDLYDEFFIEGYNKRLPSIVILEGISYNISQEALERIIRFFSSVSSYRDPDVDMYFLLEYMVDDDLLSNESVLKRRNIHRLINNNNDPTTYTYEDIESMFTVYGGDIFEHLTMQDIEKERFDEDDCVFENDDNWIECIMGKL
ncbi:MAG: class I SAM-dependent methyltransferase [Methanosarcinaceae archaeon]|nr:class I SAM-dependent methyltransferase [Methanosarcinaceae archaeon]